MNKLLKTIKAFSLVELMISLITISLITAAFTPVITKKLTSATLSVGSFGKNEDEGRADICGGKTCDDGYYIDEESCQCKKCSQGCEKCTKATNCIQCQQKSDNPAEDEEYVWDDKLQRCVSNVCKTNSGKPSEACCQSFDAKYLPSSITQLGYDLCMFEYNAGDTDSTNENSFEYAKYGVALNSVEDTCSDDKKSSKLCCWKGKTSNGDYSFSTTYPGDKRTVCMFNVAMTICDNISYKDSLQGAWRSPTNTELMAMANIINSEKVGGGIFSRYLTNINETGEMDYSNFGLQLCDMASSAYGSNLCPNKNKTVCLGADTCAPNAVWGNIDRKPYRLEKGTFKEYYTRGKACNNDGNCWYNYYDYASSVRCVTRNIYVSTQDIEPEDINYASNEPRNQEDCDKYNAIFINKKYTKHSRNLCMLSRNFGDTDNTSAESNFDIQSDSGDKVLLVSADTKCSGGYCCWKGVTSDGNGNFPYSGTNRTVCRYNAAQLLCKKFAPKINNNGVLTEDSVSIKHWRTPSSDELNALMYYMNAETKKSNFINKYIDSEIYGLHLCDSASSLYGTNSCPDKDKTVCLGANRCSANTIWSDIDRKPYILKNGVFQTITLSSDYASSVRCVTDTVAYD